MVNSVPGPLPVTYNRKPHVLPISHIDFDQGCQNFKIIFRGLQVPLHMFCWGCLCRNLWWRLRGHYVSRGLQLHSSNWHNGIGLSPGSQGYWLDKLNIVYSAALLLNCGDHIPINFPSFLYTCINSNFFQRNHIYQWKKWAALRSWAFVSLILWQNLKVPKWHFRAGGGCVMDESQK
jgi:hypothetical protein